jgi:hypothetical protein
VIAQVREAEQRINVLGWRAGFDVHRRGAKTLGRAVCGCEETDTEIENRDDESLRSLLVRRRGQRDIG